MDVSLAKAGHTENVTFKKTEARSRRQLKQNARSWEAPPSRNLFWSPPLGIMAIGQERERRYVRRHWVGRGNKEVGDGTTEDGTEKMRVRD